MEVITTRDGSLTLRHNEHGEAFHSVAGARIEAFDLYVKASGFLTRLEECTKPVRVLDVGLGLGYNVMATMESWYSHPNPADLSIFSLEIAPELVKELRSGKASWQANWNLQWLSFCGQEVTMHPSSSARCDWKILIGDAFEQDLGGPFDFIWQDPFSPTKNPTLWTPEWFMKLRTHAHEKTRLMTYSVSRTVKNALEASGWSYQKIRASTAKRHWLTAVPLNTTETAPD